MRRERLRRDVPVSDRPECLDAEEERASELSSRRGTSQCIGARDEEGEREQEVQRYVSRDNEGKESRPRDVQQPVVQAQ